MPGISRDPRRGWRYQFTVEGKAYSKAWFSTKAEAIAAREEHRKAVKAEVKTGAGLTFKDLCNEYLDYSQRRHAKKTYQYKIIVFRRFLEWAGDLPADRITVQLLESFLRTRTRNTSYNNHRKALCALLTWAWKRRMISENPCAFLESMPEPKFMRTITTPEEVAKLFIVAGPDRPLLLVLYHTLARVDEVLRMRWDDVNFTEDTVRLWTRKRKSGALEPDLIPMNRVLHDTLWSLWVKRDHPEYVFVNPKTNTRYMARPKLMRGLCKLAGIRHMGFQELRHYVASFLQDTKKVSLLQVSRLMRHQKKATTERYSQVVDQTLREAMTRLEEGF
jgi:integrase